MLQKVLIGVESSAAQATRGSRRHASRKKAGVRVGVEEEVGEPQDVSVEGENSTNGATGLSPGTVAESCRRLRESIRRSGYAGQAMRCARRSDWNGVEGRLK